MRTATNLERPTRMCLGLPQAIVMRSSRQVLGMEFSEAAGRAVIHNIRKREEQQDGILYKRSDSRPIVGAFDLVSEETTTQMGEVLTVLGLRKFEDAVPVDFFIKPTVLVSLDAIAPTPLESEIVFVAPLAPDEPVRLLFRLVVMDPLIVDENGKNLNLTHLPEKWVEQVLNTMNPAAYFRIVGQQLPGLFARAAKLEQGFKAVFAAAVKRWQERAAPKDLATLKRYLGFGLLHEYTHALALHLPDRLPEDLPAVEKERLRGFSLSRYVDLLTLTPELQHSVVFIKNVIKALSEVKDAEPGPKTQNHVIRNLALEMLCDRFGVFMYETSQKLQIYHEALPDFGEPFPLDYMRLLERERRQSADAWRRRTGLAAETAARLDAACTETVYVSAFGDPPIIEEERTIFEPFLDHLRRLDREKTILTFTEDETGGGLFVASRKFDPSATEKSPGN
jgi:hypothetical protein